MEYVEIDNLKKLESNPRQISEDSLAKLIQSIRDNPEYFEARPIICSNRTGELVIIGGNMRYEASKFLGLTKVPVCVLSGLSEQKEREITIRDNVNNGAWDWDKLANEWDEVDLSNWGVEVWNNLEEQQLESEKLESQFKSMTFSFTAEQHENVKNKLATIPISKEEALLKLLGL